MVHNTLSRTAEALNQTLGRILVKVTMNENIVAEIDNGATGSFVHEDVVSILGNERTKSVKARVVMGNGKRKDVEEAVEEERTKCTTASYLL